MGGAVVLAWFGGFGRLAGWVVEYVISNLEDIFISFLYMRVLYLVLLQFLQRCVAS
jgi:hypothetical protein